MKGRPARPSFAKGAAEAARIWGENATRGDPCRTRSVSIASAPSVKDPDIFSRLPFPSVRRFRPRSQRGGSLRLARDASGRMEGDHRHVRSGFHGGPVPFWPPSGRSAEPKVMSLYGRSGLPCSRMRRPPEGCRPAAFSRESAFWGGRACGNHRPALSSPRLSSVRGLWLRDPLTDPSALPGSPRPSFRPSPRPLPQGGPPVGYPRQFLLSTESEK
jgi:hypothetical protein